MIARNVESLLCCVTWTFFAFYSLYLFGSAVDKIKDQLDHRDLERGWFGSRYRDVTDVEWHILKYLNFNYVFVFLGHILVTQLTWKYIPQLSLTMMVVYGTLSIWIILGKTAVVIIYFNIFTAYLIHLARRPILCHLFFIFSLILSQRPFFRDGIILRFDHDLRKLFIFDVLFGWLNAKCLSFSLDRIETSGRWANPYEDDNLTMIYAYCLYFPTLIFGPMHQYSAFLTNMVFRVDWNLNKFLGALKGLTRFFIYALVYDILNHFIYATALTYRIDLVWKLDSWTLCAFAYSLIIMFYLKYLIMYGYSESFGNLDGIVLPPPPKCVSTIHLSSDLWRHFDRGLHLWLVKYYYKPLLSLGNNILVKIFATLVCFSIVALWHTLSSDVIVWCMLNFCAVAVELTGLNLRRLLFTDLESQLSTKAIKRWKSTMATPFYVVMIITNVFFLANMEIGILLFKKVLFSFPYPALPILIISYTACHVSIELKEY